MTEHSSVEVAERVLTDHVGTDVRLRPVERLDGGTASAVLRCSVTDAEREIPRSVVVKVAKPGRSESLFNDWAACLFLSGIPASRPLGPMLYGGESEPAVIVLEDLGVGEGRNTLESLMGSDPERAKDALLEHIRLIGELHGSTMGRVEEYQQIRSELGPQSQSGLFDSPWANARIDAIHEQEVSTAVASYRAAFALAGLRPASGVADEIESVATGLEGSPGPFAAFCQGDQNAPGGCIRIGGRLRLLDFGESGYRHALIEGMPGRMTWGCIRRIPAHLIQPMDDMYRVELMKGFRAALDGAVIGRAMVEAGARWNVFHVLKRLPEALLNDRPRGPLSSLRQQLVAWLDAFVDLSTEFGHYSALRKSATALVARLRSVWPTDACELPYYRAFEPYRNRRP